MYNKINIEKKDKLGLDRCRWRCSPHSTDHLVIELDLEVNQVHSLHVLVLLAQVVAEIQLLVVHSVIQIIT